MRQVRLVLQTARDAGYVVIADEGQRGEDVQKAVVALQRPVQFRSEERRVGKECRL